MSGLKIKTIVVLIALPEEYDTFRESFPVSGDVSSQHQVRLEHDIGLSDFRLISVLAEDMGSQNAASSTIASLEDLNPNLIVVLGIAGGLSSDLTVGDVCVANEVFDVLHNNKVEDAGSGGVEIRLAPDFYAVDAELIASFTFLRNHPNLSPRFESWRDEAEKLVAELELTEHARERPRLLLGPVACGPVSASKAFNNKLKSLHRKVLAIETESGGVFGSIAKMRIPAVTIRGISDLADESKAALEKATAGRARELAMSNATAVLKLQLQNVRFVNVAVRHHGRKSDDQGILFKQRETKRSIVAELDDTIRERLKDLSYDFKARPEGFYLPVPRVRRINYVDSITGRELDDPENIVQCLEANDRILIRLPRSFPSQALGWSLAHSLIRQQIGGKAILPFVVSGDAIRPPNMSLERAVPLMADSDALSDCYQRVLIVEEPPFESRSKLRYLQSQLNNSGFKVLLLTKAEDNVTSVESFMKDLGVLEHEMAPVSFSETAFFLERAFDMDPREAEVVAIKLDDTFRRFKLDAHPTYFAGLQEETLAALINANKRAELIQLAVDGLLSLVVASDRNRPRLSRTTRERFLKRLVLELAMNESSSSGIDLNRSAKSFLDEFGFELAEAQFLSPFFNVGILYQSDGRVRFSHPYLESYLLAQALRDDPDSAVTYFDPRRLTFNYYAYDLYCEMGPDSKVVDQIVSFSHQALSTAAERLPAKHAYLEDKERFSVVSHPAQLRSMSKGIVRTVDKLEQDSRADDVRAEKQRILDARRHVRTGLGARRPEHRDHLPPEIKEEFDFLDMLSRGLTLSVTTVGSGAESLNAARKTTLGASVLSLASKFTDGWIRNRLRLDFNEFKNDVLEDDNIWSLMDEMGADQDAFDAVKEDLQLFLFSLELNFLSEPMGRVLWRISSIAGNPVLKSIVEGLRPQEEIEKIFRSAWLYEVDAERGKESMKATLSSYSGTALVRVVLANHLLMRVFWHHYKRASSVHFITGAKRVLSPLGLIPPPAKIEKVKKGPQEGDG